MLRHTEIGIDLGMYEIKIARVKEMNSNAGNNLRQLESYQSYRVNSEMYSKDYFDELKRAIVDFSRKIKRRRLSLNFSLPVNEHTETLFMNVPSVSEKDLDEGIKFEAEQLLIGKDLPSYKSTWKIIEEYVELNEYEVLFATLDSRVMKHFSQFKTINWKVNRVMLQPVILEKLTRANDVIIDSGYKSTRIYMYKDGKLAEVETIEVGGFDIEEKIDEHIEKSDTELSIDEILDRIYVRSGYIESTEQASTIDIEQMYGETGSDSESNSLLEANSENLLSEENVNEEDDTPVDSEDDHDLIETITSEIEPVIASLMDETKGSIRSFELKNGVNVDDVYYTGELFNLKYLDMKLESELDVDLKKLSIVASDTEDMKYDLAGLAMLSPKSRDKMDFSRYIKANIDYTSILVAILAVSLSTTITVGVANNKYDEMIDEQIAKGSEQTETINRLEDETMYLQDSIDINERFIGKIEILKSQKKWLSDALYVIPDLVPLSVSIEKLDIVDRNIIIEGYSADYSSIGFFAEALKEQGTVEIDRIDDYEVNENFKVYSVVTDNPETISKKYLMTKKFKIIFNHNGQLLKR